jgi:Icc protein
MKTKFKVVQISDCHVSADPDAIYRGINPRTAFEQVLPAVIDWKPDLILLTGDLAEDASDEAYAYLATHLAKLDSPILTLPGNHDYAARQNHHFVSTAVDEPLVFEASHWRVILLNSAVENQIAGSLSDNQLEQLERELSANDKPTLVALHHQPLPVGSPWIDRYPLLEPEKLYSCLENEGNVQAVVWGHIHQEFSEERGDISLLGSPSSSANSLPGRDKFTYDERGPACRWLKLDCKGGLETGILRPVASSA